MFSFKSAFSLSSFTFIKRLFSLPFLCVIRVVPYAYLMLLIFLPEILILMCASSSLTFCTIYSAYKLNKQDDNIQPYANDTTLMAENKEELKSLLMKVKEESEKADLKLNIQRTKITASGPITSWQMGGETNYIFGLQNHWRW